MKNLKSIKSPTRFYKVVDAVNVTHNSKVDKYPDDMNYDKCMNLYNHV